MDILVYRDVDNKHDAMPVRATNRRHHFFIRHSMVFPQLRWQFLPGKHVSVVKEFVPKRMLSDAVVPLALGNGSGNLRAKVNS